MTATPEHVELGKGSLFAHAMALHRRHPDSPLPRDGYPFPDDAAHRTSGRALSRDWRRRGVDVAAVLDRTFATDPVELSSLLVAFHGLYVPINHNEHIAAAALRHEPEIVSRAGRHLVRHSPDRCGVKVGLALLASSSDDRDVPLLQTIALLSNAFSPLACETLLRRRSGGAALEWLGPRVDGWGRVYVVEALCKRMTPSARHWLLRHGCTDDFLAGYYAGKIAVHADLHTAITTENDSDLIDHTTRLLSIMATCHGQGMTLDDYPAAVVVLQAHARQLARLQPTQQRVLGAVMIAGALSLTGSDRSATSTTLSDKALEKYLRLLRQPAWQQALHSLRDVESARLNWGPDGPVRRLGLLETPPDGAPANLA